MASSDRSILLDHRHPKGGFVRLTRARDEILIECRWPFDLDVDDWVYIANTVGTNDYRECLRALVEDGEGRARGIQSGFIAFVGSADESTRMDLCVWGA
jgi:hypothetical protein